VVTRVDSQIETIERMLDERADPSNGAVAVLAVGPADETISDQQHITVMPRNGS
jgi:hypothetical protein